MTFFEALPGINPKLMSKISKVKNGNNNANAIDVPVLGYYIARLLSDPSILALMKKNPKFERGFKYIDNELVILIEDMIVWIEKHMVSCKNFIEEMTVSEDMLFDLGIRLKMIEYIRKQ